MKKTTLILGFLISTSLFASEDLLKICLGGGDESIESVDVGNSEVYKGKFDSDNIEDKIVFNDNGMIMHSSVNGKIEVNCDMDCSEVFHVSSNYICLGMLGTDYGDVSIFKYSKAHDNWFSYGYISKDVDQFKHKYDQGVLKESWSLDKKVYNVDDKTDLLSLFANIQKLYNKKAFKKLQGLMNGIELKEIKVNKNNVTKYNDIAYYLQKSNINKEALVILKKVIAFDYHRVVAHYNLADVYWALGEKEEALEEYKLYVEQMRKEGKEKRIPNKVLRLTKEKRISKFIPKGSTFLRVDKGDLNRDGIEDAILVLEKKDGNRPLLILLGTKNQTYKLKAQNENIVYRADSGGARGDPFYGVVIKNGYFSVSHEGGSRERWSVLTTFKYNAKKRNWFLHKESGTTFDTRTSSGIVEEIENYVKTVKDFGVISFEEYK